MRVAMPKAYGMYRAIHLSFPCFFVSAVAAPTVARRNLNQDHVAIVIAAVEASRTQDARIISCTRFANVAAFTVLENVAACRPSCCRRVFSTIRRALGRSERPWFRAIAGRSGGKEKAQVVITIRGQRPEQDLTQVTVGGMTVTILEFGRLKEKLAIQYLGILYQHVVGKGVVLTMRVRILRTITLDR